MAVHQLCVVLGHDEMKRQNLLTTQKKRRPHSDISEGESLSEWLAINVPVDQAFYLLMTITSGSG
jgi:hypothetical protein